MGIRTQKREKGTAAGLRPRRKVAGKLCRRPATPTVKSGGQNILHVSAHEEEGREKQPRVAACEWIVVGVSSLVGRSGDYDPGGRVTCWRWVARVV